MPRYWFDLRYDDQPWSLDDVGDELDSPESAREEAVALMSEIVADRLRKYWQISVRVRNDEPEPLLVLSLSMTAQARGDPAP